MSSGTGVHRGGRALPGTASGEGAKQHCRNGGEGGSGEVAQRPHCLSEGSLLVY